MKKLNKNQKIGIGIGSAFLAIVAGVGIKRAKDRKSEREYLAPDNYIIPPVMPSKKKVITFPLKQGDYNNPMVKRFQKWANGQIGKVIMIKGRIGKLEEDGDFGKHTLKFVKALLKSDVISKSNFDKNGM